MKVAKKTVFLSPTTEEGGIAAIDFDEELFLTEAENTYSIALSELEREHMNILQALILDFQKYNIVYNLGGAIGNFKTWIGHLV